MEENEKVVGELESVFDMKEALLEVVLEALERNPIREVNVFELMQSFVNGMKLVDAVETVIETIAEETVDAAGAIQKDKVICLECGKEFSQLTGRHIASHGMTIDEYKKKWGYKKTQKLICLNASKKRSKAAKERGVPEGLQKYLDGRKAKKEASETPPIEKKQKPEKKKEETQAEEKPATRTRRRQAPAPEPTEAKTEE